MRSKSFVKMFWICLSRKLSGGKKNPEACKRSFPPYFISSKFQPNLTDWKLWSKFYFFPKIMRPQRNPETRVRSFMHQVATCKFQLNPSHEIFWYFSVYICWVYLRIFEFGSNCGYLTWNKNACMNNLQKLKSINLHEAWRSGTSSPNIPTSRPRKQIKCFMITWELFNSFNLNTLIRTERELATLQQDPTYQPRDYESR